jgi:hypothetical protein
MPRPEFKQEVFSRSPYHPSQAQSLAQTGTAGSENEAHPQQAAGYRSLNTQFRSKLRGIRPTLD